MLTNLRAELSDTRREFATARTAADELHGRRTTAEQRVTQLLDALAHNATPPDQPD